ncbi:MAG: peptidylprolyl isomerase [Epsilonproteobacteria bacterium]|nr:MAG: peptidylprolyl isomerase [Campylobacterota bacterium]RLA67832.1 MAG: peptidylprolyl isomerase [Campylobacterota bacterium]
MDKIKVELDTNYGKIVLELDQEKAPITVKNFLSYVDSGHYNGTIFHRVISNFMIQGGGFKKDMSQKQTMAPIKNEANNGLTNEVGTVAMARTNVVDSATSQFFINVKENSFLNHKNESPAGYGYAVFGKVVEGMPIVNKIKGVRTTNMGGMGDVPETPVEITAVRKL